MIELTITVPDKIAQQVSRLPDPQDFVIRAVEDALRRAPEPVGGIPKWARVVAQIESLPGLGDYEETFQRSQKEFRRSFRFKHDES
ncbi:MAG TPA: hypothetical protein VE078_12380 [Thermoanaerobaculia bacterium]|nr:hypothetical protein [Thermoanaerobaculia bacterium]